MRWLWLQRIENQRSWHELPIEHEHVVDKMFQASIYVELGNGHKVLFWSDRWVEGHSLPELVPCLCYAVRAQVKKKRTVAEALQGDQWIQDISGALTVQVLLQYIQLWDRIRNIQLLENQEDRICWRWTPDKTFSTASAYLAFFNGQHPIEGAKVLRKTHAPG